jgi:chromosome segregation ATPase
VSDTKERLEKLQQAVKTARDEKVRLEERAKAKSEERASILAELKELGVSEKELDATIEKLAKKLDTELAKAEQILSVVESDDPVSAAGKEGEFTQGSTDDIDDDLDDLS